MLRDDLAGAVVTPERVRDNLGIGTALALGRLLEGEEVRASEVVEPGDDLVELEAELHVPACDPEARHHHQSWRCFTRARAQD
jgi:hypothetical protein